MGLFSNRGAVSNARVVKTAPVRYDFLMYDEEFHRAYETLARGSWAEARQIYDTRDDAWLFSETVWDDSSTISVEALERVVNREKDARAVALVGLAQVRDAWAIRGRGRGATVGKEAAEAFWAGLRKAEETLGLAARLDPALVEPWVGMLATARGLHLGVEEARRRFDEAHARAPFHPTACDQMMQMLCQKWFGSHEQMFEFARWVEKGASPGSPARGCLPLAHVERIITPVEGEKLRPSDYLKQRPVASELQEGLKRLLAACPDPTPPANLKAFNLYAFAVLPHDKTSASLSEGCFARVADRPTALPWRYLDGDFAARFIKVRDAYLADSRARLAK